jgi:zinc protease
VKPDDILAKVIRASGTQNLTKLRQLSTQVINPGSVNWFIVGDKSKIMESLKPLGYEIVEVDADGNLAK